MSFVTTQPEAPGSFQGIGPDTASSEGKGFSDGRPHRNLPAADAQTANTPRRSGIGVRPIAPADIAEICDLLEHGFGIAADDWRPLYTTNWLADNPARGFVLTDGGRIVGHVATLYSQREINGKTGLVCNFSGFYIAPGYRGRGLGTTLVAAAVRDERVTYTTLTPAPARTVRASLGQAERRIYDDHASYGFLHMTARDAGGTAYLVAKRRVRRTRVAPVPLSLILHCSAPDVLARNFERIKLAIMWQQKTFGIAINERLFPKAPRAIRRENIAQYRSPVFTPNELDLLYSEFVLLDI
jgi:acetoacetyl-CoA synthetase